MRTTVAITVLIACALLYLPPTGVAGTPAADLASLNALRLRNGLPDAIVENPTWSANCRQHTSYMRQTLTVTHTEDPASPWYTEGGSWAGANSVLSFGNVWGPNAFIWENAPLHFAQVLAPQLAQVGIADDDQYVCMTTWPGYTRPVPAETSVLTYPGNGTAIYASQATDEWPQTPVQALGLANPTGPHLYVFEWGGAAQAQSGVDGYAVGIATASVVGPSGPVAVRWVDRTTPGIGAYLPPASGIIVPINPLAIDAVYRATVRFANGVAHTWTFSTTVGPVPYVFRTVRVTTRQLGVRRVCARRSGGTCARWVSQYRQRLTVRGRLVDFQSGGGYPGITVTVTYRGIARAATTSDVNGAFMRTYVLTSRRRTFDLPVALRANGTVTATYIARFR